VELVKVVAEEKLTLVRGQWFGANERAPRGARFPARIICRQGETPAVCQEDDGSPARCFPGPRRPPRRRPACATRGHASAHYSLGDSDPPSELCMRAVKRKRPLARHIAPPPCGRSVQEAAIRAVYVGSAEHKRYPSFAGPPAPRSDASQCPPAFKNEQRRLTRWLRQAIAAGQTGAPWEGDFPRYVWFRDGGTVYEGRLSNREQGHYKGYPIEAEEAEELGM